MKKKGFQLFLSFSVTHHLFIVEDVAAHEQEFTAVTHAGKLSQRGKSVE